MANIIDNANIQLPDLNSIRNIFNRERPERRQDDYVAFIIEELNFDGTTSAVSSLQEVTLIGNQMPFAPFRFGGEQRLHKMYYPGNDEPSMQVLGPKENNVTINGQLKDIKHKDPSNYGASQQIRNIIENIRYKGSLCKFVLGDWRRYGFIEKTDFKIIRKSRIDYSITLNILTHNVPTNAKFIRSNLKTVPFKINAELADAAQVLENLRAGKPEFELSISELIDGYVGNVAEAISTLTGFVDSVFGRIDDIRQSIDRAVGLISFTQARLARFKRQIGVLASSNIPEAISSQYQQAAYYAALITMASSMTVIAERYRTQFGALAANIPLARYVPIQGDTWPKIAVKFYNAPDAWAQIPRYNNLDIGTEPVVGVVIEIPRAS